MITYVQPQLWKGSNPADQDRVFAAIAIPPGGVFHSLNMKVGIHAAEVAIDKAVIYGIDGYAIPVHDADAVDTYDTIWDLQVPKTAEAVDTLDLDVELTDPDPDFEPGELD